MLTDNLLREYLESVCPDVHSSRLSALLDVASALKTSRNLSLTSMGRRIKSQTSLKHRVKKVDRLESNHHLHAELSELYGGLSDFIFQYIHHESRRPIIVDLCYMQDNRAIQMLSAEIPLKGRSIPVYREIFSSGTLKGRASGFLSKLRGLLAQDSSVIIIMDAGFGEDWLQAIEQQGWDWILRIRKGKNIRLMPEGAWINLKTDFPPIGTRAKSYAQASIMSRHAHACRIVTKKKSEQRTTSGYRKRPSNYHVGNDTYRRAAKEPWILATSLSSQDCSTPQIVAYYSKRMQIEESFRDVKSHRYGLGARYAKTTSVERWGG